MSKYDPLGDHLAATKQEEWNTTFSEIERIIGSPLPHSARTWRAWWANEINGRHVQARSWLSKGWRIADVNLSSGSVTFKKNRHNAN